MKLFLRNFQYLIFFLSLLAISSCRIEGPQRDFKEDLATASPDFQQGWTDGCEVGRATGGNAFYRSFINNNKIDGWKLTNSPDYQIAWNYSFWYCYRDDHIDQKSSPTKAFFGGMQ